MTQCFSIFLFFHNSRELLIAVNHPDDITHLQHSDNRKRFTFLEKLTYNSNDNYCRSFKVQGDHVHARFQLSRKHIFFFFSFSSRQFHLPPPQNRHDMRRISIFNRQSETSFSKRFPHSVKVSNVSQERLSTDVIMLGYRLHESPSVSAQLCTRVSSKKAFDVSISGEKSRKNSLPSLWKRFTSMIRSVLEPVSRNFKVD